VPGKSASLYGGLIIREFCNASESFLRVVWARPPSALDPGKEIARGQPIIKVKVVAVHDDGFVEVEGHELKLRLWYHDPVITSLKPTCLGRTPT